MFLVKVQVVVEGNGGSRTAILNRPSSLNAINTPMVSFFMCMKTMYAVCLFVYLPLFLLHLFVLFKVLANFLMQDCLSSFLFRLRVRVVRFWKLYIYIYALFISIWQVCEYWSKGMSLFSIFLACLCYQAWLSRFNLLMQSSFKSFTIFSACCRI